MSDNTFNNELAKATERNIQVACGYGGDRNLHMNDLARPILSENGLSQSQRNEVTTEAERVAAAVKATGDVGKAINVTDHPKTPFSVKLDFYPHRDPNGPRQRCPVIPETVTFPPPAMEGSYKMIGGNLHIINSKGGYTPFDSVLERLRSGPRASI